MPTWKKVVVSGSAISQLNNDANYLASTGAGILSSSAQIATDISGSFTAASASFSTRITTEEANVDALQTDSASFSTRITGNDTDIAALQTDSGSFSTRLTTEEANVDALQSDSASFSTRVTAQETFSASLDATFASEAELNASSSALTTAYTAADTTLSSSLAADIATNVTDIAALQTDSASFSTRVTANEDFSSSLSTTIISYTGSFSGDGSGLTGLATNLAISGSTGNDEVDLLNDDLSIVGTANEIETTVTNNQVAIGIVDNPTLTGNVTITGNLEVSGTTTTVDSTTIELGDNILALNGTGAALGGIHVNDGPASGSLLWDGTNDRWIAGASGSEVQVALLEGQGLLSGSAQIAANISGSFTATSASIATRIATNVTNISSNDTDIAALQTDSGSFSTRITAQEDFSSSLGATFATDAEVNAATSSLSSSLAVDIAANLASINALDDTYATDAELNASSSALTTAYTAADTTLSSSVASDIATNVTDIAALQTDSGSFSTRVTANEDFSSSLSTTIISYTGSFSGDGSGLTGLATNLAISGSTGNDEVDLLNDDLSIVGTANEIETTVTNNQVQIGIVTNPTLSGNVTISGNLEVQGTTTTVDSTTVELGDNILALNGTGAAQGGIHVNDGPLSGSLIWDGTNNYWKAGQSGSEVQVALLEGQGLLSGSAQIATNISGAFGTTSSSLASRIASNDTDIAALQTDSGSFSTRVTANESFSSSLSTTIITYTGSFSGDGSGLTGVVASGTISSSAQIASDISGSFTSTSASIAADIATNLASINALDDTYATDAELNAATSSLSGSLATDIATNLASINTLNGKTLVSGSTFSVLNQGTIRATINGFNTDLDTGLQQADSPTFDSLTLTGDLTVQGTTTSIQTTNLNVEDQFILVNSGSAAADGGLVFNGAGAAFGWDQSEGRFALDYTGATADQTTITSDAYVAAVAVSESDVNYQKDGNIFVSSSGEAYIYVS